MQAQRYFVERTFQECKTDIGMCEYQVRGRKGWCHYMAICMMAQAYVLSEKITNQKKILAKRRGHKEHFMRTYVRKDNDYATVEKQMNRRRQQRNANRNGKKLKPNLAK